MQPQNTTGHDHRALEDRLDAFRDGVGKLIDRVLARPAAEPSRVKAFTGKATETIKAYPLVAAACALGLGYVVVRIVRR